MDKNKRTFLYFGVLAFLGACATPYQEDGLMGGVTATPLSESVYEVRADGNAFIGTGQIKDYALLKAAEICKSGSFSHFIPLNEKDTTETGTIQNNTYNTDCNENLSYGYNCKTTGGGSTTYSKPGTSMRIKLLGANDEIPPTAFSCSIIYNSLAPKYIE